MRRPSRAGLSLVLALCAGIPLAAQNLESIGREKPFSFSGGLSFNQIFYSAHGIPARREPYSYVATGNLNLSLYGWTVPLTFSLSNQHTSFSQPFNQYSLHPTWKWITAHAGYTSMSFSPYTVSGHIFLGGAIDLAPEGKWKFSALCGQFLRAVPHDTTAAQGHLPAYQRMGYGMKATYGGGRDFIDLILFHAEDKVNSIGDIPDSLGVTPQENLVLSLATGKTVLKHFLLKAELAATAITKDTRAEKIRHNHLLAKSNKWFQPRLSSAYYEAFKTSFDYQKNNWMLGFAYERVDPGYRTLGAYYFNNDLENITMNGSAGLLDGKLNLAGSAGLQRDNLDKAKVSTMRRMVVSLNASYAPSQKLNVSAAYSTFQTYTNIRSQFETINQLTPFENPDTLNFIQIARNASLSGMYTLQGTEDARQHINLQLSWQDAAEMQGEANQNSGTRFYNLNASYAITRVPENINVALSFNTTINEGPFVSTRMMGPTASVGKSFLQRKIRATLSSSYNRTYSNGVNINTVLNNRVNGALSLRNKHNINVSAVMVSRATSSEDRSKSYTEFTTTVGYSYHFGKGSGG